jgi:hypothetical protein
MRHFHNNRIHLSRIKIDFEDVIKSARNYCSVTYAPRSIAALDAKSAIGSIRNIREGKGAIFHLNTLDV